MCFLGLDGFTSTFQEKLFKEHKTSKYNQMLYINSFSGLVSFITLVTSGDVGEAFGFCGKHPLFAADAFFLSASSVGGQWFIYSQVKEFGALVVAATMNLRQVLSILLSYVTFQHPVSGLQVVGLALVFGALSFKSYAGLAADRAKGAGEAAPLIRDVEEPQPAKAA
uniref:Sugar phosphate transporter domain-containing protein n=1 Tax=Alexandrium monilatum TaxID=311494 RepID=A0A7S4SQ75_9DINO